MAGTLTEETVNYIESLVHGALDDLLDDPGSADEAKRRFADMKRVSEECGIDLKGLLATGNAHERKRLRELVGEDA